MNKPIALLASVLVFGWCVRVIVCYATKKSMAGIFGPTIMAFDTSCCLLLLSAAIICIALNGVEHD